MAIIRAELTIQQNTTAQAFKYLSPPGRVKILMLLLNNGHLTLSQIQEQTGLSQAVTSNQVKPLKDAGLAKSMQLETAVFYSLNQELLENIKWVHQNF